MSVTETEVTDANNSMNNETGTIPRYCPVGNSERFL